MGAKKNAPKDIWFGLAAVFLLLFRRSRCCSVGLSRKMEICGKAFFSVGIQNQNQNN